MTSRDIPEGATVEATDGEVGWERHVVVDPQTRDVTDLAVE